MQGTLDEPGKEKGFLIPIRKKTCQVGPTANAVRQVIKDVDKTTKKQNISIPSSKQQEK